jgi:16S rRNA (uracil1498-N3)-methyltransferase
VREPRILLPGPLAEGERDLDDDTSHYLLRVLRRRPGDPVIAFDGAGTSARGEVLPATGRRARVRLDALLDDDVASPLATHLVLALLKGDRMDTALQKACELGVDSIRLATTRRSEVRLDGRRLDNKLRHWAGVLRHATQQSGRARLPALHAPESLETAAAAAGDGLRLVMHPEGEPLGALVGATAPTAAVLATGPEGGFDDEDLAVLAAAGYRRWRLGPRVLRAETAPLAGLAVLQVRFGDLG